MIEILLTLLRFILMACETALLSKTQRVTRRKSFYRIRDKVFFADNLLQRELSLNHLHIIKDSCCPCSCHIDEILEIKFKTCFHPG